jgi:hypothetical protein
MLKFRQSMKSLIIVLSLSFAGSASAQSTEDRFNDLFVTAGYCTAFGAAIGTAFLGLTDDPSENLKYVATGASLGFLGGSVLGSYIIFSPGLVSDDSAKQESTLLATHAVPSKGVTIRPYWSRQKHTVTGIEAGTTLLTW